MINKSLTERLLGIALAAGADFAELYWELTRNGGITLLGGKIKEALDKVVDALVAMSEGRMPEGVDPSMFGK